MLFMTQGIGILSGRSEERVLAESDFRRGQDSWTVKGGGAALYQRERTLAAKGKGKEWHFVAPPHFLGDKMEAYLGVLQFRLGHAQHMGAEMNRDKTWGVHLEGRGIAISAVTRVGWNKLRIAEDGGWSVTKGRGRGHAPTQLQLLVLLSDVTALKIRGNYFSSDEMTWIDGVKLLAGAEDVGKLRERVEKSAPSKRQPEDFSKPPKFLPTNISPTHLVGVGMVLKPEYNDETHITEFYVRRCAYCSLLPRFSFVTCHCSYPSYSCSAGCSLEVQHTYAKQSRSGTG